MHLYSLIFVVTSSHVAPFWQAPLPPLAAHSLKSVWQSLPTQPGTHWQRYAPPATLAFVPECWHVAWIERASVSEIQAEINL